MKQFLFLVLMLLGPLASHAQQHMAYAYICPYSFGPNGYMAVHFLNKKALKSQQICV